MNKPGVMFYFDLAPALKRLSTAEKGELFDAILEYGQFGVVPDFSGVLGVAWDFIQPRIDTDNERYNAKCEQARKAISERWQKRRQTNTDEYGRIQANTKDTNSTTTSTSTPTSTSKEIMPAARAASSLFGSYENVKLTDDELSELKSEFPSDYAERIERLSEYIASTGKRYKSHLATIRAWARREKRSGKQRAVPTAADYHVDATEAF